MQTPVQWKSDEPLYLQFCAMVRGLIDRKEWAYGQKVPSERQLAEQYGIDRRTIRKAVDLLAEEGLLTRRHGRGTYVDRPPFSIDVKRIEGFAGLMKTAGGQGETRVLATDVRPAGKKLAGILRVGEDCPLFLMVRLRYVQGSPVAVEYTHLRQDLVEGIQTIDFSLYSLSHVLADQGVAIARVDEEIAIVKISNPEAKLLGVPVDEAAYLMEDVSYDAEGTPVEYTRAYVSKQLQIAGELT